MHRHRRCQQYRQAFSRALGVSTHNELMREARIAEQYEAAMQAAFDAMRRLPEPAAHYLLPFGARSRFLFKMDFAEADYIARLRSRRERTFQRHRKVALPGR